ncbi:unnamed protein product [Closterium sp. Naga37s-1]|nr:unnamed protein product [Closterium sp. Naga37s-1]
MGGCLSVEVIAESAPSSPFGNVTSTTPRSRAHSVVSTPGGNQRYATGFSPRTPREAGDGSEAEGNGAGGGGVAGGGGKFRRGAGRGKRVGSGVGGAKAVSSGGGRGGGGEGGEGGWGRGAERQGGAVGRGNGRGGGGDGYGGGGNLAAPQSVPVEQTAGVPSHTRVLRRRWLGSTALQSEPVEQADGVASGREGLLAFEAPQNVTAQQRRACLWSSKQVVSHQSVTGEHAGGVATARRAALPAPTFPPFPPTCPSPLSSSPPPTLPLFFLSLFPHHFPSLNPHSPPAPNTAPFSTLALDQPPLNSLPSTNSFPPREPKARTTHLRCHLHQLSRPFPPPSQQHATSTNSAGLSATQSTSSDPKDGRGTARKFRLHELRAATSSFSKKAVLGRGSFGEVYLGKLGGKESKEVVEVAVKKLNPESSQGLDEWLLWEEYLGKESKEVVEVAVKKPNSESSQGLDEWLVSGWRALSFDPTPPPQAEIVLLRKLHHPNLVELIGYRNSQTSFLSLLLFISPTPSALSSPPQAEIVLLRKLHHPNLVELIGYCAEKGEALLVYGLCPNGSLDDRLFPREAGGRYHQLAHERVDRADGGRRAEVDTS